MSPNYYPDLITYYAYWLPSDRHGVVRRMNENGLPVSPDWQDSQPIISCVLITYPLCLTLELVPDLCWCFY